MGLPKITFIINSIGLGLISANVQKTPGLVLTGNSVTGKIAIGESKQFFSLEDAENSGITELENPFAYKHLKDFYNHTGTNAEIWLMLASDATKLSKMASKNENIAKKLINDAGGKIRVLGLAKKSIGTETIANGLDADTDLAVANIQELADEFVGKYFPFRSVVSGNNYNGNASALKDYRTTQHNRVSILIANTDGEKEACIGLALGKIASIPVQRKISRVKDGAVENFKAYFTNGQKVEESSSTWDAIADKNYIFLRNFIGKAGYYFTSDPTLTQSTDDFKSLSNGFVMDKAMIIAYNVLVENLGDEVPLTKEGNVHPAIIKYWQSDVERNINARMTNLGELSACKCYINENQNVLSSGTMEVEVQLLPIGYAEFITVKIGFTTQIN